MYQHEAVIETLRQLGGIATLGKLNEEVFKIHECVWKTKTPFASIRRIVQERKEIYRIKPGLYGLVSHRKQLEDSGYIVETEANKDSIELKEFDHTYYQGLLLTIGNINQMQTFCPNQDKNKKFINETLAQVRSLHQIPSFSYANLVKRSSTIDVIWFNERQMPCCFFEVEHSTDFNNSLGKFNDLQDFHSRMFIVADKKREEAFKEKYAASSFKDIYRNKRVEFLSYAELNKQYEQAIIKKSLHTVII